MLAAMQRRRGWSHWRDHWDELTRHEEWNVGVVEAPIAAFLRPGFRPTVRWLPLPPGCFRADPFAVEEAGDPYVFCEEWNAATGRGRLVAIPERGATTARPLRGLPRAHASFPFLLRHDGILYCLPELHETGKLRLFRAVAFPADWQEERELLPLPAVDPVLFFYEGRWWLAASRQDDAPKAKLWLWHAPDFAGPWRPHAANPVKASLAGGRNAGTPFPHQGALFRPAQDCSNHYGGAVILQRITRLTPEEFAEEPVARVEPAPDWPYPDGLHHLAAAGERTWLDALCVRFSPAASARVFGRKARRWLGAPR